MSTLGFGEKLKRERERRNTSIEEIAEQTKIALRFLQALEEDRFDELPGRAFGKFYIRAYAEVLKFDPEPLIVEYDRQQASESGASVDVVAPEPSRPRRMEAEIKRWREAKSATQPTPRGAGEERETGEVVTGESAPDLGERSDVGGAAERADEARVGEVEPADEHVFDRDDDAGGARYDEAAALASILGARDASQRAWRRWRNGLVVVSCAGLVVVLAWVYMSRSGSDDDTARVESPGAEEAAVPIPASDPTEPDGDRAVVEQDGPRSTAERTTQTPKDRPGEPAGPAADSSARAAGITVTEFGVGRRVVNRRLEGRGESFEEGSVVWFQTRVVGGSPGTIIRHVWLRDGSAVQAVELEIGGAHWRTHSRKTLWGTGQWTVEARDVEGNLLARANFACVPARP